MSIRTRPAVEPVLHREPVKRKGERGRFFKKSSFAEAGNEIWLLTLSDLLMLLLIFFVLLFGWMLHNRQQAEATTAPTMQSVAVAAAVSEPVLFDWTFQNQHQTEAKMSTTDPIVALDPVAYGIVPPVSVATADTAIPAPIAGMGNHDAVLPLELDLQTLVGGEQGVTVERRSSHIVATFSERFLFDSGHSDLKRSVDSLLKKVAFFILEHPELSVEIDGHTDDRPIKSSRFPSNWELSADRATQVAKALVGLGVEPTRLSIKGFGEYRPRYANDSDENRLKNRRVEIQFSLPLAS